MEVNENRNRRQAYRVRITRPQVATVSFKLAAAPGMKPIRGVVFDLSIAGVGITLSSPGQLCVGQRLVDCVIMLPGFEPLPFDGVVRHTQGYIGIGFVRLSDKVQRRIFQFVSKLEIDLARGRSEDTGPPPKSPPDNVTPIRNYVRYRTR